MTKVNEAVAREAFEHAIATHNQDFGEFFLIRLYGMEVEYTDEEWHRHRQPGPHVDRLDEFPARHERREVGDVEAGRRRHAGEHRGRGQQVDRPFGAREPVR